VTEIKELLTDEYSSKPNGQFRRTCPACSHMRKGPHKSERVLSLKIEWPDIRWMCHHCGERGGASLRKELPATNVVKFTPPPPSQLDRRAADFLHDRGIGKEAQAGVISATRYIRSAGGDTLCVGFPYHDGSDQPYAIKWRGVKEKGFTQDGAAATFYGIEKITIGEPIIIFEGELDVLSGREAGLRNCISAPNGAPMKVSEGAIDPSEDRKFAYVWHANDILQETDKVIIACDRDGPGVALAEELARRIGKAQCWQVEWPDDCKDANDVLLKHGRAALANAIDEATPWPIAGLYAAEHYFAKVDDLYANGEGRGNSTGYECVDELFTIKPGMLHVVTGIPSMGKSEFVDQLIFNLARQYDWKSVVCSFENPPAMHIAKLAEKVIGKPFHKGPTPRMSAEEMEAGLAWINDHFVFMEQSDGTSATIDQILDRATAAVRRIGVRILVIDPYNYIDLPIGGRTSETNLISDMLTKVRNWASAHDCAVFFIAHPAKLYRQNDGSYPAPKGYDISASASWFSKTDLGITVHRNYDTDMVEIHAWKVRWKTLGKQGMTELKYDIVTGTYSEDTGPEIWEDDTWASGY